MAFILEQLDLFYVRSKMTGIYEQALNWKELNNYLSGSMHYRIQNY